MSKDFQVVIGAFSFGCLNRTARCLFGSLCAITASVVAAGQSVQPMPRMAANGSSACYSENSDTGALRDFGRNMQDLALANPVFDRFEVSDEEERRAGREAERELLKEKKIWNDSAARQRLEGIFSRVVSTVKNKKALTYKIILVDSEDVNASTIGGVVFFYRGMYEFARSDSELAAVLGHEIQHNELGHIKMKLKKYKISESVAGDGAGVAMMIDRVVFASFNQKDEIDSDLTGVDLVEKAGFNGCDAVNLWRRMGEQRSRVPLGDLLQSHPYSGLRESCLKEHLLQRHGRRC